MVSKSDNITIYGILEFRPAKRLSTIANGALEQLSELQEHLREVERQLKQPSRHSSGDWNFKNTSWTLDSTTYVSSPSSLHFTAYTNNTLVKTTTIPIANVKEGRIITYLLSDLQDGRDIDIVFRYQDDNNYYFVKFSSNSGGGIHSICKYKDGVLTTLKAGGGATYYNTWYKIRITWWNDYVGLVIRVEMWNGTIWVTWIADAYDNENLWQTIGGRIGFGSFHDLVNCHHFWIDDTEIYGIS